MSIASSSRLGVLKNVSAQALSQQFSFSSHALAHRRKELSRAVLTCHPEGRNGRITVSTSVLKAQSMTFRSNKSSATASYTQHPMVLK
jgi:hypothetical protein